MLFTSIDAFMITMVPPRRHQSSNSPEQNRFSVGGKGPQRNIPKLFALFFNETNSSTAEHVCSRLYCWSLPQLQNLRVLNQGKGLVETEPILSLSSDQLQEVFHGHNQIKFRSKYSFRCLRSQPRWPTSTVIVRHMIYLFNMLGEGELRH